MHYFNNFPILYYPIEIPVTVNCRRLQNFLFLFNKVDFIPNLKKTREKLYGFSSHKLLIRSRFGVFLCPIGFNDDKMPDENGTNNDGTTQQQLVMRVSVKLPHFWKTQPELWFKSAEAQFALPPAITCDLTKYNTVVAALDCDILAEVSDIIMNPPATGKYDELKEKLVERFTDSETKRLQRLLAEYSLEGKKPSQLLREMRTSAGNKVGEDFLKTIWLNNLPNSAKSILSTVEGDLNKLAETADKILEINEPHNVAAISHKENKNDDTEVYQMKKQIEELTKALNKLSNERGRSRSGSRSGSKSGFKKQRAESSDKKENDDNWLCWYHFRFGEKANACIKPCAYKQKN